MAQSTRPVVWISHRDGEQCSGCGRQISQGDFVSLVREQGVRCVSCAGLAALVYLPSGDPALTRRALAVSPRSAIVVKFSRARKRNERQGALVEASALGAAEAACKEDAARREAARGHRRVRDEAADREYVATFAEEIRRHFPRCPSAEAEVIARRACEKHSGRVGRSRAAKAFDARPITLAVRAHIRHLHTQYDELLGDGLEPSAARPLVADKIGSVLAQWRGETAD